MASTVNVSRNDVSMKLVNTSTAEDAFETILLNKRALKSENGNLQPNQLSALEREQLTRYLTKYEHQLVSIAGIADFFRAFDTYLHFIAFAEGRFRMVTEYTVLNHDEKEKKAFIVLNGDMTVCGPLFLYGTTVEQQVVFPVNDDPVDNYVKQYIDKLNRTDPRSFPVKDPTPDPNVQHEPSAMDTESVADALNIGASEEQILPNVPPTIDVSIQSVEELFSMDWHVGVDQIDPPSTTSTITTQQENPPTSDIIEDTSPADSRDFHPIVEDTPSEQQLNDSDCVLEAELPVANPVPGTSTSFSNTTVVSQNGPAPMSTALSYAKPEFIRHPKADWSARYPRDLIPQPKKNAGNGKIKFIGLLQGMGRQRSLIEVKVPAGVNQQMYLASAVRTLTNEKHSLKLIVPVGTQVNKDRVNHENYLNYLEFHQCDPAHFFDLETWTVYMRITSKEHKKGTKKVPIYMFNLYQNQQMTKDLIKREQLDKCRLVFWFARKQNECYIQTSEIASSMIITERKKKKQ